MKRYFIAALAVCAALVSCEKQEEDKANDLKAINFSSSVGEFALKATDTAFEQGDAVGVFAFGQATSFSNVRLTWDGQAFVPDQTLYWGENQNETEAVRFVAYYPYNAEIKWEPFTFTVKADQSTHAAYTASDLMAADVSAKMSDGGVQLKFQHMQAKIVLKIDNQAGLDIADIYVGNLYGKMRVDPVEFDADLEGSPGIIKAGKVTLSGGAQAWALITVAQRTKPELVITTTDGKQFTYTVPEEVNLYPGRRYNATVVVKESSIYTDFTADIEDWVDDEDIQFGQDDEEDPDPDVVYAQNILEVMEGPDNLVYCVTGTVSSVDNLDYGNYCIKDNTGELLIYGTKNADGKYPKEIENGWYSADFGLAIGDVVTVKGPKITYGVAGVARAELVDVVIPERVSLAPLGFIQNLIDVGSDQTFYHTPLRIDDSSPRIDSSADWAYVVSIDGDSSASWKTVVLKIEENNTMEDRDATISFTLGNYTHTLTIIQRGTVELGDNLSAAAGVNDGICISVSGIVHATSTRGFVLYDGTLGMLVYTASYANMPSIGDKVQVKGTKATYNGMPEIARPYLTYQTVSSDNPLFEMAYEDISAKLGPSLLYSVGLPVKVQGKMQVEKINNVYYYSLVTDSGTIQLYWPDSSLDLNLGMADKEYIVTGFYNGYYRSSNLHFIIADTVLPISSQAPITIDGSFEDWDRLNQSYVFQVVSENGAEKDAMRLAKVYATAEYIYVYFEYDEAAVKESTSGVWVHVFLNADGDVNTGGYGHEFSDACMDACIEGTIINEDGLMVSYDPGLYKWEGPDNGFGWEWGADNYLSDIRGFASGAGVPGKYELSLSRSLYPLGTIADTFSIGLDIQKDWFSVGILPNAEADPDLNPNGTAPSLWIQTAK